MNIYDYQVQSRLYAIYPNMWNNLEYPTLGLVGEAGEIANKVKKVSRDGLTDERGNWRDDFKRQAIVNELGDVLWYLARVADELGADLDHIAQYNLDKLASRQARGVLGGDGDNR